MSEPFNLITPTSLVRSQVLFLPSFLLPHPPHEIRGVLVLKSGFYFRFTMFYTYTPTLASLVTKGSKAPTLSVRRRTMPLTHRIFPVVLYSVPVTDP